jgi:hypothetical protein
MPRNFILTPYGRQPLHESSDIDWDEPMTVHELDHHVHRHGELRQAVRTLANQAELSGYSEHAQALHNVADAIHERELNFFQRSKKARKANASWKPPEPKMYESYDPRDEEDEAPDYDEDDYYGDEDDWGEELNEQYRLGNVQEASDPHATPDEMHDHLTKSGYIMTGAHQARGGANISFYSHRQRNAPIEVHWKPARQGIKTQAYARIHNPKGGAVLSAVTLNGLKDGIEQTS